MFRPLRSEVESRFASIESYFSATKTFKGDPAATAKGLMFVQVYAAYEYTVKEVVRTTIESINRHRHRMRDISPPLLALYLDPELSSLRDCGRRHVWSARRAIFERAFSADFVALPIDTGPPTDGSHYRASHLVMILSVFNIRRRPARKMQHLTRINEVVSHRNGIAHGTDTAENVGRRYTRAEILHMERQMKSVCTHLVSIFDGFCANPSRHRKR